MRIKAHFLETFFERKMGAVSIEETEKGYRHELIFNGIFIPVFDNLTEYLKTRYVSALKNTIIGKGLLQPKTPQVPCMHILKVVHR